MATVAIEADSIGGYIRSDGTAYADARAGTGTGEAFDSTLAFTNFSGQTFFSTTYRCFESFLRWNIGANVPQSATIYDIQFTFRGQSDNSDTDFDMELRQLTSFSNPITASGS